MLISGRNTLVNVVYSMTTNTDLWTYFIFNFSANKTHNKPHGMTVWEKNIFWQVLCRHVILRLSKLSLPWQVEKTNVGHWNARNVLNTHVIDTVDIYSSRRHVYSLDKKNICFFSVWACARMSVAAAAKIYFWVGGCSKAVWAHWNVLALYCEARISTCHNWWRSILSRNNGHYRGWYQDIIFGKLQLGFFFVCFAVAFAA